MSYARFGADSDVYVFESVEGVFECCGCRLHARGLAPHLIASHPQMLWEGWRCASRTEMISHLLSHREDGDEVPQSAIDRLSQEILKLGLYAYNHGSSPTRRQK
jgi:hypothetical protein